MIALNAITVLKKFNALFIVHFGLSKYSFFVNDCERLSYSVMKKNVSQLKS